VGGEGIDRFAEHRGRGKEEWATKKESKHARKCNSVREVKRKARERRASEEGRGIAWKSIELNLAGVCGQRHCLERLELNGLFAC